MKMSVFSILTLIFMMFTLVPNSVAEDSPQWHLPEGVIARLGKGTPMDVQYSPDGTQFAVATAIGVWLYDADTGEELDLLTVNETDEALDPLLVKEIPEVRALAYSPNGRILAIAGGYQVQLWDAVNRQPKTTLTGHTSSVLSVSFSPDGRTLASSSFFSEVRLWDVDSGQYKTSLWGHTEPVESVSFSPDGRTLASASVDTVRLWNVNSGQPKATLIHENTVNSISFSPDGRTLASGCMDRTVRLWNVNSGQPKATLTHKDKDTVNSISFSPDGRTLASSGSRGVHLWNVDTMQRKTTLEHERVMWRDGIKYNILSGIDRIAFSPDGQMLAGVNSRGVHLWDVDSRQHRTILLQITSLNGIAFSPDRQTLATSFNYGVSLWDAHTGKYKTTLIKDTVHVESIVFSPDGRTLAGVSVNNTVRLWDAVNGQHKATLKHTGWVWDIAFSPDGRTLASGSNDNKVLLWDVATLQPKATLIGHTNSVWRVVFSPDGRTLVSGSWDGTVRLWDVATFQPKATLVGNHQVSSVSFSPDGRTLVSSHSGTTVWLWDAHTGKHKATLPIGCRLSDVAFTFDNNTLILSDSFGRMRLWDIVGGEELGNLIGHKSGIRQIAFSPDGRTLASRSKSGIVFLWDVTAFVPQHAQQDTDMEPPQGDIDTQHVQQDTGIQPYERERVRLIYFRPTDQPSRQGIDTELDTLIRWSQYFFAEQMQNYGRKTFAFETDATGYAKVHHVTGKFTDTYYHSDTYDKVVKEVAEQFDTSRDVYLIAVDVSSEFINQEGTCGIGGGGWKSLDNELWRRDFGGTAVIPASGVCINPSITAHELGHVFGLEHDFRDGTYLMAYGTQERLSPCAAAWLDAHRFFNNDPTAFNETTTIAMHPSQASEPGTLRLQFELTDTDGLHQAQLIVPAAATDPAQGTKLHSCKSLNGKNQTVAFLTTDAPVPSDSEVTLQVVDGTGNITRQTFSLKGGDITSNRSPVAVGTIPEQTLTLGGSSATLNMSSYFSDSDNDVLSYRATSNNTSVVTVSVSGTRITIAPRGIGGATVTVTASDGKLSVVQHLSVHVSDTPVVTNPTDNFDDSFEGTALQNPNWQWQNEPANWDVGETREGFLHIESETNRNLWASDATHFLYQETDADTFDVETHFFARWDTASGVNGLVVKSPADNNWVTLKFWSRDAGAKGQIQYQTKQNENGSGLTSNAGFTPTFGNTELFFRLRKQGNTYTGWYKTREVDSWIEIGVTNFALTPPLQLGIYAGVATGTGTLTVDYDYFRSTVDTGVLASPVLHVAAMEAPSETTLLPNYPNPFNPETWIPYQLLSPADVTVHIYTVSGDLVRRLSLGHRAAGMYHSRNRAAYWDGRNGLGELVASGVYFYTLTAGDFTATRKMLIRK